MRKKSNFGKNKFRFIDLIFFSFVGKIFPFYIPNGFMNVLFVLLNLLQIVIYLLDCQQLWIAG